MKTRTKILIVFVNFLLISVPYSCAKAEQNSEITLEISNSGIVSYQENELSLSIGCESEWNLAINYQSTGENWCSLSQNQGLGDQKLVINIEYNTWQRQREAEITLKSGNLSNTIQITQGWWGDFEWEDVKNVEIMTQRPSWMELPVITDYPNSAVVSHDTYINNSYERNFTMLYDTINKIAHWVAYPISPIYIGITDRTDDWGYDPKIPQAYQPKLASSFPDSNYDRGHILASATRTSNYQTNAQTFYYSNMTAQQAYLNRYYISSLEEDLRNWAETSDTLYVVTGVKFSDTFTQDKAGADIAVPDNYFYVVLSLSEGVYNSIGFWFENVKLTVSDNPFANYAKSVEEIETLTGFEFFAQLEDKTIKSSFKIDNWPF